MEKQETEMAILQAIFEPKAYAEIIHGDKPDFKVVRRDGASFGVEVTELYPTETDARLHNQPDYMIDLFAGQPHLHKDDIEVLQTATVTITDEDGNVKQEGVPAVFRETSTARNHADAIAEVIIRKNGLVSGYDTDGLEFISLVILDWFPERQEAEEDYALDDLLSHEARQALRESPYREVFLLSVAPDGTLIYRQLRLLLILEALFTFGSALEDFDDGVTFERLAPQEFMTLFVLIMGTLGEPFGYGLLSGVPYAIRDCAAATVTVESGVSILDFFDGIPISTSPMPDSPVSPAELQELTNHTSLFFEERRFRTAAAANARLGNLEAFFKSVGYVVEPPASQGFNVRMLPNNDSG